MIITSRYLVTAAIAVLCISLSACTHSTRQRYRDELVEITDQSTVQLLNVHGSTHTKVLTIWGRNFKDVRGLNPCYLVLTNKHLILFVTGKEYDDGQAVVHLADVTTRKIRDFPAHDSHIGRSIGAAETNCFERVLNLDGDQLVIEAGFRDRRSKYFIDLSGPRFEREEADFEDTLSHKVEHYVYVNGRIPTAR